jgi:hypothetical protein
LLQHNYIFSDAVTHIARSLIPSRSKKNNKGNQEKWVKTGQNINTSNDK